MNGFLANAKGWFTKPLNDRMSPLTIMALVALVILAIMWTHDGIRVLSKGFSEGVKL